uniref:Transglutaminase-like domain-containing protein n=1 Tax=Dunaliella tertiolecta TaxID=3047 RepID=A0A7S3QL17_DUNTE
MEFLLHNMPESDRKTINSKFLSINVDLALKARQANSWAADVPWEIFLNYVLPYASLDEKRDDWRPVFSFLFSSKVRSAHSLTEAAQILNHGIWKIWGITFQPDQTPEIMSPFQVIEAGYASCTGLSIFLVNACRSVGIPARVVGTPSWKAREGSMHDTAKRVSGYGQFMRLDNHHFNNHNWVEVWDGTSWSFCGALEANEKGLNRTWFFPQPAKSQIPGDKYHAIYAATFAPAAQAYPLVWDKSWSQPGIDVTQSYIDAKVPQ